MMLTIDASAVEYFADRIRALPMAAKRELEPILHRFGVCPAVMIGDTQFIRPDDESLRIVDELERKYGR